MREFKDKVAIVAAASSGIGKGIAKVLSNQGCKVFIFSKNRENIENAAREIKASSGNIVECTDADLGNRDHLKKVVDEVHLKLGKVDFLVMNYGDPKVAPFTEISEEEWDESINMILKSSIIMSRLLIPDLIETRGKIVFVTSTTTKQVMENFAISGALRSAVINLSKTLSIELAQHGISVNSIAQGFVFTERLRSIARQRSAETGLSYDKVLEKMKNDVPMKRFAEPEEIGDLVSFLCSKEADYITGTNIQIDGGRTTVPF